MNVRIIKKADRKQITKKTPEGIGQTKKTDAQTANATTVRNWIVELRRTRESERQAIKSLFGKEADYRE